MDRIERLERKMDVIAKWFDRPPVGMENIHRELKRIDAEPAKLRPPTDGQTFHDGRISVWNEIDALLAGSGTKATDSVPDRIRALLAERDEALAEIKRLRTRIAELNDRLKADRAAARAEVTDLRKGLEIAHDAARDDIETLRAEIDRLEARDREGRDLIAEFHSMPAQEWTARRGVYLGGGMPKPDPLLVEVREVLQSLRRKDDELGWICWCTRGDMVLMSGLKHADYCDRANALLAKLDARIGGG